MNIKLFSALALALTSLFACKDYDNANSAVANTPPPLTPDYQQVTIPSNISPLNFRVDGAKLVRADFIIGDRLVFSEKGKEGLIKINQKEWRNMLAENAGLTISVEVTAWNDTHKEGIKYLPFEIHIASDPIDRWLSYRLIEPGHEGWAQLGIYQRDLTSNDEIKVVDNSVNSKGCLNCHSFANYNAECMLFHSRSAGGGTVFYQNGKLSKVDFSKIGPKKQAIYPKWNPNGRFVAFSSNATFQTPYAGGSQHVEVYDTESDLILYDYQKGKVITDPRFMTKERWETYPEWSADGKWLYFCSAEGVESMPKQRKEVHYDLLRVAFDEEKGLLREKVDTIYNTRINGGSVSYPRISPDGRYLMFTHSYYGTFPIWHNEADLRTIDLNSGEEIDCNVLNSELSDSYHSWSSTGRWVVFGSRRLDGRYTRLYIAHCSEDGKFGKPFLLPQQDPNHNIWRLKSYNIPELTTNKIALPQEELKELLYSGVEDQRFTGVN